MDFASGLANLEQSAANAQNNRRRGRDNNDDYHNRDDNRRYQSRPRRDYHHNHRDNHHHHHGRHYRDHHHRDNRDRDNRGGGMDRALDGLARFGYRLPRSPYSRPPAIAAQSERPLHICLLAITIDDLHYEHIWKAWAKSNTTNKNSRYHVSLVCHAKHPNKVQSKWLQQRMILLPRRIVRGNSLSEPEYLSHQPAWGSVEITRAMMDTLVAAMEVGRDKKGERNNKDHEDARFHPNRFYIDNTGDDDDKTVEELAQQDVPPVDKFIFISETCVPVTTLEETVQALFFGRKCVATQPKFTPPPPKKKEEEKASTTTEEEEKPAEDSKEEEEGKEAAEEGKETTNTDETEAKTETEQEEATNKDKDNPDEDKTEEQKDSTAESDNKGDDGNKEATDDQPTGGGGDEEGKSGSDKSITTFTPHEMIYLDVSWVNARNFNSTNTPSNKYERDQFNGIFRLVPKRYRWKADQWMCLSRTHASAILDIDRNHGNIPPKDQLWNSFRRINASDEMYFPTALALAGVLVDNSNQGQNNNNQSNNSSNNSGPRSPLKWTPPPGVQAPTTTEAPAPAPPPPPPPPPQQQPSAQQQPKQEPAEDLAWLERRRITYTDWSMGARNPACFTNGIRDFRNIARLARQQKCLLARKFAPFLDIPGQDASTIQRTGEITVEEWRQELESIQQTEEKTAATTTAARGANADNKET